VKRVIGGKECGSGGGVLAFHHTTSLTTCVIRVDFNGAKKRYRARGMGVLERERERERERGRELWYITVT